ncbi:hypothetical protein HRbin36_02225 [bacterium HR36]|nr:hypothetical protein HRbin36_02225 [bacterium HR36]
MRKLLIQLLNQGQGHLRVIVHCHQSDVRLRLPHHIYEKLVAGALRLQPDRVQPQQGVAEAVARLVIRIDQS